MSSILFPIVIFAVACVAYALLAVVDIVAMNEPNDEM